MRHADTEELDAQNTPFSDAEDDDDAEDESERYHHRDTMGWDGSSSSSSPLDLESIAYGGTDAARRRGSDYLPSSLPTMRGAASYDAVDHAFAIRDDLTAHPEDLRESLVTALSALTASRTRVGELEAALRAANAGDAGVARNAARAVAAANRRAQMAEARLMTWARKDLDAATKQVAARAAREGNAAEANAALAAAETILKVAESSHATLVNHGVI